MTQSSYRWTPALYDQNVLQQIRVRVVTSCDAGEYSELAEDVPNIPPTQLESVVIENELCTRDQVTFTLRAPSQVRNQYFLEIQTRETGIFAYKDISSYCDSSWDFELDVTQCVMTK
jgi:hypothetical protein